MKYVSPRVAAIRTAVAVIQGVGKVIGAPPESVGPLQGTRFPPMKPMSEERLHPMQSGGLKREVGRN
jgi:hypothetical protein